MKKAEKSSLMILKNYKEYLKLYSLINEQTNGGLILIETMAWKFHQDVLCFESEAIENLERIKMIINMQQVSKKHSDND